MKAFLLAAGEGRRLRPLTDSLPKCLVPIQGTPLLGIWLDLLKSQGISRVLINVHHHPEQILAFIAPRRTPPKIEIVYEKALLGSAGTVLANREFVKREESFLVLYADNLSNVDLGKMLRFHRCRTEALTIGIVPTDRPCEKGTVRIDPEGRVVEFAEKAPNPPSNLASAGIYVARQRLFDYLPGTVPRDRILDFGHDVLPRMTPDVAAFSIGEFLMDIGTPESYARAQERWRGIRSA